MAKTSKKCISIHSLVKRETIANRQCRKRRLISIHSLVKRETHLTFNVYATEDGISIHSLVKRETPWKSWTIRPARISIHSLVKRETPWVKLMAVLRMISIHSLVKRETMGCGLCIGQSGYFNPLPRKEGDLFSAGVFSLQLQISIHSLVKRETPEIDAEYDHWELFQSTPS